ncbi:MAG TPA: bifunctional UDP-N-acetylglucosamine diphosphorylase/glucosamine-1-phosphate N-acetyltransferase GlmU [Nevskiaceae bacterium]|nr:bifunctional UDP-N-acetylglucosamine diphosphorylase/glucosamine-1-phosphate N-acetyltransferase GlmU [Nevskiaceae bacterium]
MSEIHAVILAAGKGTRMRSQRPKVLHEVAGRPMLAHVIDAAQAAGVQQAHVVVGHGADQVRQWAHAAGLALTFAEQREQLGTAHAVAQALPGIPDQARVWVLYGDVPLVDARTLEALARTPADGVALVTARLTQPRGYGRILRDAAGQVVGIVEENDASPEQRALTEINTGILAAPAGRLRQWLARVRNDNAKGEYYLTDVIGLAVAEGVAVQAVLAAEAQDLEGVNDRAQLARAERRYQQRQAQTLLDAGLTLADPARFDLRGELRHGQDVFIDVGVVLEGRVVLGDGVRIGPYAQLRDVVLGERCEVLAHSVLEGVRAGTAVRVGPFARLRPGTELADEVHIGNFVEVKQARLGTGTKAGHLAYLGDAVIGAEVNVSAGVITCNYDGANKHLTTIGDGAFIGSDSQLVAPVTVGARAFIAAGSTITREAPADQLTIARHRGQTSLAGWKRPTKKR